MSCATVLSLELLGRYLKPCQHTVSTWCLLTYNECGGIRPPVEEELAKPIESQEAPVLISLTIIEQNLEQAPNNEEQDCQDTDK